MSADAANGRQRAAGSLAIAALLGAAALWMNWRAPVGLRIAHGPLNVVAFLLGIVLLPALAWLAARGLALWSRRTVRTLAALLCLAGAPVATLGGLWLGPGMIQAGDDPSFERLHEVSVGHARLSVFRTNGGAMTAFGIVVRQERVLLPGIRLVRPVFTRYPAADATVADLGSNRVSITVAPHGDAHPTQETTIVALRPLLGGF